jgi:uncharacterized protein YjbJ (UPF0337 family)
MARMPFIDNIKGKLKKAKGSVKTGLGAARGNSDQELEGRVERAAGHVQDGWGDLKRDLNRPPRS